MSPRNIRVRDLKFGKFKEKDFNALEMKLEAFGSFVESAKQHFDKLTPQSRHLTRSVEHISQSISNQLDVYRKRKAAEEAIRNTHRQIWSYTKVFQASGKEALSGLKKIGFGFFETIDDVLDTFFGPLWKMVKGIGETLGKFIGRLGLATLQKFGLFRGERPLPGPGGRDLNDVYGALERVLLQIQQGTVRQDENNKGLQEIWKDKADQIVDALRTGNQTERRGNRMLRENFEKQSEEAFERNKDLIDALEDGDGRGGLRRFLPILGVGGLGAMLARLGGAALIAGAIIWMIRDFVKGFRGGGITRGLATAFAGKAEGGLMNAVTQMGKWAMLGAGIGLVGGPIGVLGGALIGAAIGGVLGFLGADRVQRGIEAIKDVGVKIWNSIFKPIVDLITGLFRGDVGIGEFLVRFAVAIHPINWIGKLVGLFIPEWGRIWDNAVQGFTNFLVQLPGKIISGIQNFGSTVLGFGTMIIGLGISVRDHIAEKVSGVKDFFLETIDKIVEFFKDIPGRIWRAITRKEEELEGKKEEVANEMKRHQERSLEQVKQDVQALTEERPELKAALARVGITPEAPTQQIPGAIQPMTFSRADLASLWRTGPILVPAKQEGGVAAKTGLVTVHEGEEVRPADFARYEAELLRKIGDEIVTNLQDTNAGVIEALRGARTGGIDREPVTIGTISNIDDLGLLFINSVLL